jgi:hypothetical protein
MVEDGKQDEVEANNGHCVHVPRHLGNTDCDPSPSFRKLAKQCESDGHYRSFVQYHRVLSRIEMLDCPTANTPSQTLLDKRLDIVQCFLCLWRSTNWEENEPMSRS